MTEVYGLLLISYYIAVVAIVILIYYKNGVAYKVSAPKEVTTPPSDLTYAELSMLLYNKLSPDVFICTVIDLISKNIFIVEKSEKEYFLFKDENVKVNLTESEKYILKILDSMRDDKEALSLTQIFEYCNSRHNKGDFSINYSVWKKITISEVKKHFYEEKIFYNVVRVMTFLGIALVVLDILLGVNTIAGYIAIVPIIGLPQFFNKVCKRTEEYTLEYEKWLVFKDYLIEHNSFALSRTETFKYLCYGIMLDIRDFDKKIFKTDFIKYLCKALYNNIRMIGKE